MFKPSFKVVTSVLVVLTALGLVAQLLRPHIPLRESNRLSLTNNEFLLRAAHQPVDWRVLSRETIAEARRLGKPLLLLVGVSASSLIDRLDEQAFNDTDIARYLNRNFVCVRVDGLQNPEWLNAFFPVSRLKLEFLPGFQIWVLDPSGQIIGFIGRTSNEQVFTGSALYQALIEMRQTYDRIAAGLEPPRGSLVQKNDLAMLSAQEGSIVPGFEMFNATLLDRIDDAHGGLPRRGLQQPFPLAWRYLAMTGQWQALERSLVPVLRSPMVDLIDGGFFRLAQRPDYKDVVFNKMAQQNAEMLCLLTLLPGNDAVARYLAERTFDLLLQNMRTPEGIAAFQIEEATREPRNERYGFSLRRIREALAGRERTWAREHLGLDLMTNPRMSPYLARPSTVSDPLFPIVLRKLQASAEQPRRLSGTGFLDVEASVTARMIEAARLTGDASRLSLALDLAEALDQYRSGSGLRRLRLDDQPGYLGDYLAYSDAKLQDYLASGRVVSFDAGLAMLEEALKRFRGHRSGEFVLVEGDPLLPDTDMPEIADNLRESCTARVLRLTIAYARLTSDPARVRRFHRTVEEIVARFMGLAAEGGPEVAGFFCAAAEAFDPAYAIAVGPRAQRLALELGRRVPTRLVAPAFGPVRRDLQGREPGIYVVDGDVFGPYGVEEAARRLPGRFRVLDERLGPGR